MMDIDKILILKDTVANAKAEYESLEKKFKSTQYSSLTQGKQKNLLIDILSAYRGFIEDISENLKHVMEPSQADLIVNNDAKVHTFTNSALIPLSKDQPNTELINCSENILAVTQINKEDSLFEKKLQKALGDYALLEKKYMALSNDKQVIGTELENCQMINVSLHKELERLERIKQDYMNSQILLNQLLMVQDNTSDFEVKIQNEKDISQTLFEQILKLQDEIESEKIEKLNLLNAFLSLQDLYEDLNTNETNRLPCSIELNSIESTLKSRQGAIEAVKNSFSYRFGKVLVHNTQKKTFKKIPYEIYKEFQYFIVESLKNDLHQINYLEDYTDAQQGELIKQHLSYRLGNAILTNLLDKQEVKKLSLDVIEEFLTFKKTQKVRLK